MMTLKRTEPDFEEISPEIYKTETAKLFKNCFDSSAAEENTHAISYEELLEKNADLEKENAALLFQILTGEEYSDV